LNTFLINPGEIKKICHIEEIWYTSCMKINTSLHQVQKQLLAPAMQQSIETLLLPLGELNTSIDQELQDNPLLEIDEEKQKILQEQQVNESLKILELSGLTHNMPTREHLSDDETLEERPIKMEVSLEDELLQQLRMELSDPLEIRLGEFIIGSLDEDGYLRTTCQEIAKATDINDILRVEYILKIIQNFEPPGIASRNLKECLLSQVHLRCNGNGKLVTPIIENYLEELGRKKFQEMAKKLGVSVEAIREAAQIISLFEPKPARNYRPIAANLYIKPDVFIAKDENDQYQIRINRDGNPPLRINTHYQRLLQRKNLSHEERSFIREKLKNALYFIKSVAQRGQTIVRITEYILEKQKDFFENGHMSLVPLTLKDIAQTIDRNESTISRAVTNKYVDTPCGLFPLKFFFSQGIAENGNGSGAIASRGIKEEIKGLIESENKTSPLSDQTIQNYFKRKDVTIARRTISKYRNTLRILPSHLRKS